MKPIPRFDKVTQFKLMNKRSQDSRLMHSIRKLRTDKGIALY